METDSEMEMEISIEMAKTDIGIDPDVDRHRDVSPTAAQSHTIPTRCQLLARAWIRYSERSSTRGHIVPRRW